MPGNPGSQEERNYECEICGQENRISLHKMQWRVIDAEMGRDS